jgi:hypothetical protein
LSSWDHGEAITAGAPEERSQEQRAFRRFPDWLDEGVDSGGQKYPEIHRRLAAYFDRKNCLSPDSLAEEHKHKSDWSQIKPDGHG